MATKSEKNSLEWKELGTLKFGNQLFQEAIECYQKCISLGIPKDKELCSICHSNIGACFFELGEYSKSIEESLFALSLSSTLQAKIYCRIAKCYFYLKKYEESKKYMEMFFELNQTDLALSKMKKFLDSGMNNIRKKNRS